MLIIKTKSAQETKKIGQRIGAKLRAGDVVALYGNLGSGKTTLIKGIAQGLGIGEDNVSSPTFVLIHEYQGRHKVYHMDWYRLKSIKAQDAALIEECLGSEAVTLIEWADRGEAFLPKERLEITLKHTGQDYRSIKLVAKGKKYSESSYF